jgi:VWFA-related protein
MRSRSLKNLVAIRLVSCLLCLVLAASIVRAQGQPAPTQKQDVEVLRVNTELVQSPVMIFDKQGHFVDGLQREQFDLLVDGHPHAITFFDRVTAGTPSEAVKYETARKSVSVPGPAAGPPTKGSVYGRTLIFYVDDLHLAAESINRTRAALLKFIDESMGQNDRVLITTGSGQLGFLQQLTDNKDVLRAAADRLKARQFFSPDEERPPMGAYQALAIEANDSRVIQYYVEQYYQDVVQNMNRQGPDLTGNKNKSAIEQTKGESGRRIAENHIRARARNLLHQYSAVSASSFEALRYLMGSTTALPGSKLIFVISDGFFMNREVAGELQKLHEITSAAVRAGAIIYSIQASGLATTYPDAKAVVRIGVDMGTGVPGMGADSAMQAPLYTLAVDTGGRALFNSNSMDGSVRQALSETSEYYLLAWRPETVEQRSESFRQVQVNVKGHPEWTVRVHKGYLSPAPKTSAEALAGPSKTTPSTASSTTSVSATTAAAPTNGPPANRAMVEEKMTEALSALYPIPDLPTSVNVRFSDVPNQGAQMMVATEISTGALFRATPDDKAPRGIDLIGVVLNDQGKTVASFKGQLKAGPTAAAADQNISQTTEVKVQPGLYQVRVAARDQKTGAIGSASQWILIPDLATRRITLSSLFIGDKKQLADGDPKVPLSINHHFTPDSRLRFFASVYNVARVQDGNAKPDVTVQVRIIRDDQAIFTGPLVKVATEGLEDLSRIPYAAEISLRTLPVGSYALVLTATDNTTKSSATQRAKFVIE